MQVVVTIPDELAAQVRARGLALETFIEKLVLEAARPEAARPEAARLGPGAYSRQEAGRLIRELRKGNRLAGVRLKDLIHEGHRY